MYPSPWGLGCSGLPLLAGVVCGGARRPLQAFRHCSLCCHGGGIFFEICPVTCAGVTCPDGDAARRLQAVAMDEAFDADKVFDKAFDAGFEDHRDAPDYLRPGRGRAANSRLLNDKCQA